MLELKNISKFINDRLIINNVNITFPHSGLIGIKGESGCGKTSLLYIMSMLDHDYMGQILYNNEEIDDPHDFLINHISYMMQNKDYISSLSVKENIVLSSKISQKHYQQSQLRKITKRLQINDLLYRYPHQLSIGQLKRVSIAKALLKDSDILLCDEPTGALSNEQSHEVMKLLKEASKERLVVIVSHDPSLLMNYCDHVLEMKEGKLIGGIDDLGIKHNRLVKKRKHSLLFYPIKQLVAQRKKLIALCLFQWILITTFFSIVTSINGLVDALKHSELRHPMSYVMTVENKDGNKFEQLLKDTQYNYHLSLLESSQCKDAIYQFLPQDTSHIVLVQGHIPHSQNEILVSSQTKLDVGDELIVDYGTIHLKLKVSGILEKLIFQKSEIYLSPSLYDELDLIKDEYSLIYESKDIRNKYKELSHKYLVYSEIIERVDNYQSIFRLTLFVGYFFVGVSLVISLLMIIIVLSILSFERKHDIAYLVTLGLRIKDIQLLSYIESLLLSFFIVGIAEVIVVCLFYYMNHVYCIKDYNMFDMTLKPILFHQYDLFFVIALIYVFIMLFSSFKPIKDISKLNVLDILREE